MYQCANLADLYVCVCMRVHWYVSTCRPGRPVSSRQSCGSPRTCCRLTSGCPPHVKAHTSKVRTLLSCNIDSNAGYASQRCCYCYRFPGCVCARVSVVCVYTLWTPACCLSGCFELLTGVKRGLCVCVCVCVCVSTVRGSVASWGVYNDSMIPIGAKSQLSQIAAGVSPAMALTTDGQVCICHTHAHTQREHLHILHTSGITKTNAASATRTPAHGS